MLLALHQVALINRVNKDKTRRDETFKLSKRMICHQYCHSRKLARVPKSGSCLLSPLRIIESNGILYALLQGDHHIHTMGLSLPAS